MCATSKCGDEILQWSPNRKGRAMRLAYVFSMLLMCSCSLFGKRDSRKEWGEPTSAGFRVQYDDQGSVSTGRLTKQEVLALFDVAQAKAKQDLLTHHGVSPETYELYARSSRYQLVDNKSFPTDVSSTGHASGMTFGSMVLVALYTRPTPVLSQDLVPTSAPPWTVVHYTPTDGVTRWSYGVLNPVNPFPALLHELGHRIIPGKFEHAP